MAGPGMTTLRFLSTLSLRRATQGQKPITLLCMSFLSTLSLRRATHYLLQAVSRPCYFYPRSPCGERHLNTVRIRSAAAFLSTLSLRRATTMADLGKRDIRNFYPRSPCGERPMSVQTRLVSMSFLSTLSLRRATVAGFVNYGPADISIHALLAESDPQAAAPKGGEKYFYPRSPCGERRPQHKCCGPPVKLFLSTLSLRRATCEFAMPAPPFSFLSTLSLRRATAVSR